MKATIDTALREGESAKPPPKSPLAGLVAGHPFLQGMKPGHLAILTECAMPAEFKKGELIFRENDPANRFYLIRRGRVELEAEVKKRGRMLMQTIGPGDVLGWSWLFPPYYWRFDARAATPVKAIFFYGTRLREQCEQDHEFGYEVMKRTAEVVIKRLQAARKYLVELRIEGRT
jgi:CRP/FNR family cyclic AMP-dependent transcriptional regulator